MDFRAVYALKCKSKINIRIAYVKLHIYTPTMLTVTHVKRTKYYRIEVEGAKSLFIIVVVAVDVSAAGAL